MSFRAFLLAAILLPPAGAASPAESPPEAVKGADLDLLRSVRALSERVEKIRRSKPAEPPVAVRASADERRASAARVAAAWIPRARLEARGRAWSDLGLGHVGTPAALVQALAADLDDVSVDSEARRLLVDPARLPETDFGPAQGGNEAQAVLLATGVRPDEPLVAHGLEHLLDETEDSGRPQTTDALLARAAWAEGRANLLALLVLFDNVGTDVALSGRADPAGFLDGALVARGLRDGPAVERSFLFFVYEEGFAQAVERFKKGGWTAVRDAADARSTTRDVLHADRPPAAPFEPAVVPPALPPGFVEVDRDSLGEQGIVTLVATVTGKDNLGLLAADGWTGDTLVRYEHPSGDGVTLWLARFSHERGAVDFAYGIERTLQARFPGVPLEGDGTAKRVLRQADRVYRLERAGTTVTVRIVSPATDVFLARPVRKGAPTPPTPLRKKKN